MDFFGYDISDRIPCECGCGKQATDTHHHDMDRNNNEIENLIAVARGCHNKAHDHPEFNELLLWQHLRKVKRRKRHLEKHKL